MKINFPNGDIYDMRFYYREDRKRKTINTICTVSERIEKGNYRLVESGDAKQNPKDHFNKDLGRRISLGRAIKRFIDPHKKVIWEEYRKYCPIKK